MGRDIKTTGIKAGEITSGVRTVEYGVEQLCVVVDKEVVPAVKAMCVKQKQHDFVLHGDDKCGGLITEVQKTKTRSKINTSLILGFIVVVVVAIIIFAITIPGG